MNSPYDMNRVNEIVAKLKAAGVAKATAHYDGSCDSGSVDDVYFYDSADNEINKGMVGPVKDELIKAMDNLACDYLEHRCIDWYNNDGGFGDFTIDVNAGKIVLDHNYRDSSSMSSGTFPQSLLPPSIASIRTSSLSSPISSTTAMDARRAASRGPNTSFA